MCGSGGHYSTYVRSEAESQVADSQRRTQVADYDQDVSERLRDLLRNVNERDSSAINGHLDEVKRILEDYVDDSVTLRFGGSVSRHTYVSGLSDVDALVLLNQDRFAAADPQELLGRFEDLLRKTLPDSVSVKRGDLAITLTYKDGHELQLLPALKTSTGVRIAASNGEGWSNVIRPQTFAKRLTDVNQANSGRVVPVIKIIKASLEGLSDSLRPRGHHIEALAIDAFERYHGTMTTKAMLEHFFDRAAERVRTPLHDRTGQSNYLDDYLGGRNSTARQELSTEFARIRDSLKTANEEMSSHSWLNALGL